MMLLVGPDVEPEVACCPAVCCMRWKVVLVFLDVTTARPANSSRAAARSRPASMAQKHLHACQNIDSDTDDAFPQYGSTLAGHHSLANEPSMHPPRAPTFNFSEVQ